LSPAHYAVISADDESIGGHAPSCLRLKLIAQFGETLADPGADYAPRYNGTVAEVWARRRLIINFRGD
jgi:hypothetical protein